MILLFDGQKYLKVGLECILYWACWDHNLLDHSSYGTDGVRNGSPTNVTNGIHLNGIDDSLEAASQGGDPPVVITSLTTYEFEMWVKADVDTFGLWLSLLGFHTDPAGNCLFPTEIGGLQFTIGDDGDTYVDSGEGFSPVEDVWFHMVWAVPSFLNANLLNSELLFNNHSCSFSLSGQALGNHLPFTMFLVGSIRPDDPDKFKGTIGEIRLYNRIRTAGERTVSFDATKSRYT